MHLKELAKRIYTLNLNQKDPTLNLGYLFINHFIIMPSNHFGMLSVEKNLSTELNTLKENKNLLELLLILCYLRIN